MGLESIRIENFRTCRSVELSDLGHLTVLVGRNGVGKSNILQGIELVANIASSADLAPKKVIAYDASIKVVFFLNNKRYLYTFISRINDNSVDAEREEFFNIEAQAGQYQLLAKRNNEEIYSTDEKVFAEIDRFIPFFSAIAALKPPSETKQHILPALNFLRGIRYYPLDEPAYLFDTENINLISRNKYLEWIKDDYNKNEYSANSIKIRLIHMYLERRDEFDELLSILDMHGLGVLNNIAIRNVTLSVAGLSPTNAPDNSKFYIVAFEPGQGWESATSIPKIHYEALSYGTRRIIQLLVSIFYDKNSVYLFEQPEDGIHPSLLYKLIELLRVYDDRGQIIMTSHSPALLDYMRPEEVRLVTMVGGETQVRALSEFDLEGAKLFMEKEGTLSEYLSLLPEV